MAYDRFFHWGIAAALLFGLNGCGLLLETTPGQATTDSGRSDAGDAGREDSGATDSGTGDSGAPPPVVDAGPEGCASSAECDDDNPCTTDECIESACDNTSNSESCDDGVFCNGPDTCNEGSCSVHDDDPCSSTTICDEMAAACVGCIADSDCPGMTDGDWGACEGFANDCAVSGTRTRAITDYVCSAGTCVGTDTPDTEVCVRSTDGMTCGSSTDPSWSTCGLFDTPCDTSGTESRTVTDYVCAAGTCQDMARLETNPCMRSTTGNDCIVRANCQYGVCNAAGTCLDIGGGNSCFGMATAMCCGNGLCARILPDC
ncbi:MAG: hypothetical protein JRH11_17360 [Deltaproteobacteria bacterium]|nr:hypothetical protein [Deltaproteobacteria bacterium]